jgi:hypothetical protein
MSKINLLELRFYPIEGNQQRFKVSVEGFSGEVHHEPVLPFLDGEAPNVQDRRFTVVQILESTKFYDKNFDENEQAWMVGEQLLLPEKKAFKPGYLGTIGRRLYQVLGQNIQQVIESAVANAKRDNQSSSITTLTLNNEQRKKLRDALISAFPNEADLEMVLEDELEILLNTVASGNNYKEIVFNLIKFFNSQGRSQDLIKATYRANSGNPKLKDFIREIGLINI